MLGALSNLSDTVQQFNHAPLFVQVSGNTYYKRLSSTQKSTRAIDQKSDNGYTGGAEKWNIQRWDRAIPRKFCSHCHSGNNFTIAKHGVPDHYQQ
jgi:hypothetical protein